jgi:hypothetical protein
VADDRLETVRYYRKTASDLAEAAAVASDPKLKAGLIWLAAEFARLAEFTQRRHDAVKRDHAWLN